MATIFIHDTGLLTTNSTSAITGAGNVANNGDEIPLKILSLKFKRGSNLDDKPIPALQSSSTSPYQDAKINFISVDNPTIILEGQINKTGDISSSTNVINKISGTTSIIDESGTSTTYEIQMLGCLEHASRTLGYKELYYKDTSTDTIFYGLANTDSHNTTIAGTYRHFHVRISDFTATETPDSKLIRWSITCIITR